MATISGSPTASWQPAEHTTVMEVDVEVEVERPV
jgi:hypothetical protein